jgi:hypothetical protein
MKQILERRGSDRFPIDCEVLYRSCDGSSLAGGGRTVDISSRGILFTTGGPLGPGRRIEVWVNWPAQLNERIPLKLVAVGRIVRAEDARAAINIEKYEFRTQGANGFTIPVS